MPQAPVSSNELVTGRLFAVDGRTFVLSQRSGDIEAVTDGLFVQDARCLSRWVLKVEQERLRLLTSHHVDEYSNLCVLTNSHAGELQPGTLTVIRRRVVGGSAMEEEVEVTNHLNRALQLEVELDVDVDFLDLFEMKALEFQDPHDQVFAGRRRRRVVRRPKGGDEEPLVFLHEDRLYSGRVKVEAKPAPDTADRIGLSWILSLSAHQAVKLSLRVLVEHSGGPGPMTWTLRDFAAGREQRIDRFKTIGILAAQLETSWTETLRVYRRSLRDIRALLIHDRSSGETLPAAGMPWFMTIFGRDALLTSYQLMPNGSPLAWGALRLLASLQATELDHERDAQPGRIVHELRHGPVAINANSFPYYGSIDAPLLFLILLHETWRWTGDDERARSFRPAAEAILRWIDDYGDLDGDGFIEYHRTSSKGLVSQSWKDSWDSIRFHDGSVAQSPVATAEVQGYAYDAFVRTAELAAGPWADPDLGRHLTARAEALFDAFNQTFWTSSRGGFYHLALDRDKRCVDSKTSNMGHLLWSGIVPRDRAKLVVSQLMSRSLFSGWGIRTMSTEDGGFNPISYHCGTVWPHDNSLAVVGLRRYGFHEEANRIWVAIVEAAQQFMDYRLPEAFAGYDRSVGPFPIEYPTACTPQAWAAATPSLMLSSGLGLNPDAVHGLAAHPHLPDFVDRLDLRNIRVHGRTFDVLTSRVGTEVKLVE